MTNIQLEKSFVELAATEDLDEIITLKLQMFEDADLKYLLKENVEDDILVDYQQMYKKNSALHYIYRVDHQIIAMAGAFIKSDIPYCYYKNSSYGFIGDVYTAPQYRMKGLASELSKYALEWLQEKGVFTVRLLASGQAESLYKKLGFDHTDEMALYFQHNENDE